MAGSVKSEVDLDERRLVGGFGTKTFLREVHKFVINLGRVQEREY